MYSSMWFMSIVALLVVDVRTGALKDTDIQPSRCYACPVSAANSTVCAQSSEWLSIVCPGDRPLCATVAVAPDFTSSLTCAAAMKTPCSLNTINNTLELACICRGNLCNSPFTHELKIAILNLTIRANITDMTQIFFKSSKFANISEENLYKAITVVRPDTPTEIPIRNASQLTTLSSVPPTITTISIVMDSENPKAEALKQDATAPSDDDEDEGEGSGAYEETRSHSPASAPAAPSSFLPAKDSASTLCKHLFMSTLFIYFFV